MRVASFFEVKSYPVVLGVVHVMAVEAFGHDNWHAVLCSWCAVSGTYGGGRREIEIEIERETETETERQRYSETGR